MAVILDVYILLSLFFFPFSQDPAFLIHVIMVGRVKLAKRTEATHS